jgi:hypothetical protein
MTPTMLRGRATAGSARGGTERDPDGGRMEESVEGGRTEVRSTGTDERRTAASSW